MLVQLEEEVMVDRLQPVDQVKELPLENGTLKIGASIRSLQPPNTKL